MGLGVMNDPLSVYAQTGFSGYAGTSTPVAAAPAIASSAGPGMDDISAQGLLSIRNPVTWFGIFAAATFGLIAVSSTVRIGKAKASAKIGKE